MGPVIKTKVLVVGAGIAGLAAAKTLWENGIRDMIVIEAQDYIGGRIKSQKTEDGIIELGAQWLHGTDNKVKRIADDYDLLSPITSVEGCGKFIREDGFKFDDIIISNVDFAVGEILSKCENLENPEDARMSVGDYLDREFNIYLNNLENKEISLLWEQLYRWHIKFQTIDNSCRALTDLSAARWGDYDFNGDESQSHINFKNGYSTIVDAILGSVAGLKVHLEKPVMKMEWDHADGSNVSVLCADGSVYEAEHVICTVSLGVLKAQHETMFSPLLPENIATAINVLGFDTIGKILLQFKFAWWQDTEGLQIVQRLDGMKYEWYHDISGFDVLKIGTPNTLIGWISSRGAKIMESLTEEEVAYQCVKLLENTTKANVAPLKCIRRSMWFTNAYVRGGYSHITLQCNEHNVTPSHLMEPVLSCGRPALLFAGEACHDTHFSTTHGAYESGESQANSLLDFLNAKNCD